MFLKKLVLAACLCAAATVVSADVLVLESGKTLKIESYTVEDASLHVVLSERGEMVIPVDWVKAIRFDPDPIPEAPLIAEELSLPADLAYADLIKASSRRYDLDWKLVAAIMRAESNFNPKAVSPKGARGLMQLMPGTARMYSVEYPYDPAQNIEAGARHLKMLLGRYQGKLELVLAAYNSGERNVDRYRGIPPYSETRNYVRKVLQFLQGLSS